MNTPIQLTKKTTAFEWMGLMKKFHEKQKQPISTNNVFCDGYQYIVVVQRAEPSKNTGEVK